MDEVRFFKKHIPLLGYVDLLEKIGKIGGEDFYAKVIRKEGVEKFKESHKGEKDSDISGLCEISFKGRCPCITRSSKLQGYYAKCPIFKLSTTFCDKPDRLAAVNFMLITMEATLVEMAYESWEYIQDYLMDEERFEEINEDEWESANGLEIILY